ncbi:mechanosensitive ion channel family protein [Pseudoflavonifractor phocaeensis]|uniref:mechanosensitive ion channel family protein n=1 Tax=Pseudoflavonifractor phocaeensis TaxID=1870988 RepID=UPI001F2182D7|nr:mechanosensitive ion channel family protein [Pseudoflavonifractor phocaeensis]
MNAEDILASAGIHVNLGALTLGGILRVVLLVLVGMMVIRVLLKLVDRMLDNSKSLSSLKVYIRSVTKVVLWFLLVLMVASSLGIDTTSLIAMLSVAGLAVSLALQNTLSNLAGGIMLLVAKPFQVGDYVEADGVSGTVSAVDLSYTTFVTVDNKEIFVPNSQLSSAKVVNYTALGRRRVDLSFTASYEASTAAVKGAIREVLDTIPQIMADPAPEIWLTEYQSSSIQYTVRAWTTAADYWAVYFAIQEGVRESFQRHGVEMTYDHLNVHILDK